MYQIRKSKKLLLSKSKSARIEVIGIRKKFDISVLKSMI